MGSNSLLFIGDVFKEGLKVHVLLTQDLLLDFRVSDAAADLVPDHGVDIAQVSVSSVTIETL